MKRTSNVLVLIGLLAFVIGTGLVLTTMRGNDSKSSNAIPSTVLVAKSAIPAGTTGEQLVAQKLVTTRKLGASLRSPDAVATEMQLAGRIFAVDVAPGEQIRTSQLRAPALRAASIEIPTGMQGVALQVPFVNGGAGYVAAGDRVNVYGNIPGAVDHAAQTKLVLSNVRVLDVSTEVAPRVAGSEERPSGTNVTYLVALDADQAERVIYLAANAQLWLALADGKDTPMSPTPGRTAADVLQ